MGFLLFPDDERRFVEFLIGELGVVALRSDLTIGGVPQIVADPTVLIRDLPAFPQSETLLFWFSGAGPIVTHRNSPPPRTPIDRVAELLSKEAAGDRYLDLIDLARTPMLRWRRPMMRTPIQAMPGLLQSMACKVHDTPAPVLRLSRRVARWLKVGAEKINPFEHCSDSPIPAPKNLRHFAVWTHRAALEWLRGGGELWPWTA